MYTPTHMPDTQGLSEFREHTAAALKRLARSDKPLLLTQKGKAAGIIMSPKVYERLTDAAALAHSIRGVRESREQFAQGLGVPADAALAVLEGRYRGNLKRARKGD